LNRIKGITIEIGGDTTKLQTALKGVNSQIKSTESQLRDVNKLLKLDPGNTELITQKNKLLQQAVGETKEKLETLKTAQEQANQALANGEISQEQYDALQREIVETEQKLKSLEQQANESGTALQNIAAKGEKLKSMGESVTAAGEKMLPVTAGVAALGTAAVKTAADFDTSMSKVAAVSGATGDDLDALRDKAREMGSKTKFSASEAADAMNYMAMAGWKTEDMLDGIDGVMNLAAASGEDLATTSDIVTDALTAFGLTAKDSGHFADILAAASSNANTNVSMMGETFKYAAPIAGALGFSAEDTAEAIGLMANAGIKSSQAGTSLRSIMNNLTSDVKFTGKAFGETTIATTNADGSMRSLNDILGDCRSAFSQMSESEQAANAEALVGKNAMSGFLAIMNAAPADIEKLNGAIADCDGASAEMAETMQDNLAGQLTILKSQLEELAISFGELLMPAVRAIVSGIQGFVDILNKMSPGMKQVIMTIALLVAAIGPVLIVVGKVMSAVGTIMTIVPKLAGVINTVKTAMMALNTTMLANPIVLIIAAITALVAAFIYLWNTNEDFRQFWIDLWENIKETAIAVWEALKSFFSAAWEGIKTLAETVFGAIRDFFVGLWEDIKTTATNAWNTIKTAISTVMTGIQTVITTIWNAIQTAVSTVLTAIQTVVSTVWNGIKTAISTVMNGIKTVITTVWNGIKTAVTTVINGIKSVVTSVWNGIKSAVTSVMNAIKTTVTNIWNNVKSAISNTVGQIYNSIKGGFDKAVGYVKNLASQAFNWGKDLIMGIVNGIKSCISAVSNAVTSVANAIKSVLHFSVPDEGPLTDYESWMPDFMKGLAHGIDKSKHLVSEAMNGLASDMVISPTIEAATVSGDVSSGNGQTVDGSYTSAPSITIQEMVVRSDDDIRRISQELNTLMRNGRRAVGTI